jgi:hypothetical protein
MNRYWVQVSPQACQSLVGARYRLYRLVTGDVDYVERRPRDPRELDRPVCRLALGDRRPGRGVPLWLGIAFGQRLFDEHVYGIAVLGVDHHERAGLGGDPHGLEERLVVDHDRALVGHEELVARHALLGGLGEVVQRSPVAKVGDGEVEADVDEGLGPLYLLVPRRECVWEALARLLQAEVHDGGRPSEGSRGRPRGEVVAGDGPAEGHLHVGMGVYGAGDHVLAGGVDDLVGLDVERTPDKRDLPVLDEYVPDVVVGGGDDPTTLYQH